MASSLAPQILTFKAGGTIAKGKAVKFGSDNNTVVVASAVDGFNIGIAQNAVVVGDMCEVAVAGGAKGLAQDTIGAGKLVCAHTDGALKVASAADVRILGVAMEDAVAGDIFSLVMGMGQATSVE